MKIAIIGGGPVGLNTYILLKNYFKDTILFEANSILGGQLTRLYPEKEILDLNNIDSILAKDYIQLLVNKLEDKENIHLNEKIINIIDNEKCFSLVSNKQKYDNVDYIILCGGLGNSTPRLLGLDRELEVDNILYSLNDYKFLIGKDVAIFGGGDSALDWAKHIEKISSKTYLVHRRDEFRGNKDTIKDSKNLDVYLSYIPHSLQVESNKVNSVQIKSIKDGSLIDLKCDYILVNFGYISEVNTFNLSDNQFIFTKDVFKSKKPNIFVLGDLADYKNKVRRIEPALKDLELLKDYLLTCDSKKS